MENRKAAVRLTIAVGNKIEELVGFCLTKTKYEGSPRSDRQVKESKQAKGKGAVFVILCQNCDGM